MLKSALKPPGPRRARRQSSLRVKFDPSTPRTRKELRDLMQSVPKGVVCRAVHPYESQEEDDLPLRMHQLVLVVDQGAGVEDWWEGMVDGRKGFFPGTFVKVMAYQPESVAEFWLTPDEQDLYRNETGAVDISNYKRPAIPLSLGSASPDNHQNESNQMVQEAPTQTRTKFSETNPADKQDITPVQEPHQVWKKSATKPVLTFDQHDTSDDSGDNDQIIADSVRQLTIGTGKVENWDTDMIDDPETMEC